MITVDPPQAYSLNQFCAMHNFSRAAWYNLPADQRPRTMKVGHRLLISRSAADDWRKEREQA